MKFKTTIQEDNGQYYIVLPKEPDKKLKDRVTVTIEDANNKTLAQNRTLHKLLELFVRSGCSSFDNIDQAKTHYKLLVGLVECTVYEYLTYQDGKYQPVRVYSEDDIPEDEKDCSWSVKIPKSWSKATLEQGKSAIDLICNDMDMAGVVGSHVGKEYEAMRIGMMGLDL